VGIWRFAAEIPNHKSQIANKFQISIFKSTKRLFVISDFVHWNLFGVWYLVLGAYAPELRSCYHPAQFHLQ
jgi:hypothetical protein